MHEEIAIAGFGGQGVLFIGRLLAEASLREEREVVWVPSYGAAKRGGTVWCNIIISDEKIGAMFITSPTAAIAMNPVAFARFEPSVKPGGLLIVNRSLVTAKVKRADIRAVYVPANELAAEAGNDSVGNLVALGALVANCPAVETSSIVTVMEETLTKNKNLLEANKQALNKGYIWKQEK